MATIRVLFEDMARVQLQAAPGGLWIDFGRFVVYQDVYGFWCARQGRRRLSRDVRWLRTCLEPGRWKQAYLAYEAALRACREEAADG